MPMQYKEQCTYCGGEVYYSDQDKQVRCKLCGNVMIVAEFPREQQKTEQRLKEGEEAKAELEKAKQEKQQAQEALAGAVRALDDIQENEKGQAATLQDILDGQHADQRTQEQIIQQLHVLQDGQQEERGFLDKLLQNISAGQKSADEKLVLISKIADQLLRNQGKTDDMIIALKEQITGSDQEKQKLIEEFREWSESAHKEDISRLEQIRDRGEAVLNGLNSLNEKISKSNANIGKVEGAVKDLGTKWEGQARSRLDKQYRLAESLQKERRFDEAEKQYQQILIDGGEDPEVYWRILMCHYCIEYQKDDEGNQIPSILYPDLRDPSEISARSDLLNAAKKAGDNQYKIYKEKIESIDKILDKYRYWQNKHNFDVFISVKQTDGSHPTNDSIVGRELYDHIKSLGLEVFNSQLTKGPAGQEWEPYILAALMSARVMIVVGTRPEYMESQWVKNEWSRFQWLQKNEKDKSRERRLFCYLARGMTAREIPKGLNPNRQAIIDGMGAQKELDDVLRDIFPQIQPTPAPDPDQTAEQITSKWDTWLTLKKFDEVTKEYNRMVQYGQHLDNPKVHLDALCAEYELTGIDELPRKITDLPNNNKFSLADRCAETPEDRALIDKLKQAYELELKRKEDSRKSKKYALISAISALFIVFLLIALYFVEPFSDNRRDIHVECIVVGGAAVILALSLLLFRMIKALSASGHIEASPITRLTGLIHLCVCIFALAGYVITGENAWNGWILGKWLYYYESYNLYRIELYILAGALVISAFSAIKTMVQKNKSPANH